MANKFSELREKMSPERRERNRRRTEELLAEMPLHELRQARAYTQKQLAKTLETGQGNVSRLEHQADMYVSTLRSYIRAMGGDLEITARFPDGEVRIDQFEETTEDVGQETAGAA